MLGLGRRGGDPPGVRSERGLGLAAVGEAIEGVGADAVEKPVAHRPVIPAFDRDERSIDQATDDVDRGLVGHTQRMEDGFDAVEGCASDEAGQGPQATLIVREEKVVAPADRCRQRSLAFGTPTRWIAQQREAVRQSS